MLVFVCAAWACESSALARLQGTWLGARAGNFEVSALPAATAWAKGVQVHIGASRVTVQVSGESPRSRAYRVASADEHSVTLELGAPSSQSERFTLVFDGEGRLRWEIGQGRYVVLQRLQ